MTHLPEIIQPLCAVFRRKLRTEGLKYTPERARVLEAVLGEEGLFEPERIVRTVRESGVRVSKATVYRTIKLLREAGIVQPVAMGEEHALYQVIYGASSSAIVIRLDGGPPTSVEVPELTQIRDRVCASLGVTPQGHRLLIFATQG